ncbi:MAG TPA: hypothetical protein ENH96_02035 [Chlamydiae bacterium]|nr:hypothetical protein [Chlamydiota bacterium]
MSKFLVLSFLLNFIFIYNIFANNNNDISAFHKIAQEKPYCIVKIDKNKCYLDPNCLVLENGRLYVIDGSINHIELSGIFIDEKGCYVNKLNEDDELPSFGFGICPGCHQFVFLPTHDCPEAD